MNKKKKKKIMAKISEDTKQVRSRKRRRRRKKNNHDREEENYEMDAREQEETCGRREKDARWARRVTSDGKMRKM